MSPEKIVGERSDISVISFFLYVSPIWLLQEKKKEKTILIIYLSNHTSRQFCKALSAGVVRQI